MSLYKFLISLSVAVCVYTSAFAQSPQSSQAPSAPNFIEKIEEDSNGNIQIDIPDNILDALLKIESIKKIKKSNLHKGINKVDGFRIQVFSDGTNQRSLESRARARGTAIANRFPKYRGQIYCSSHSPYWFTRVGNFETKEDAAAALSELKSSFPQYAGDMRIVQCQIVVLK